jgi:hypothetical protein
MNKFDQFVKHKLKAKHYIRYCDDFVIFSETKQWLEWQIPLVKNFLWENLRLELQPDKVFIKTLASGMDVLGRIDFGRKIQSNAAVIFRNAEALSREKYYKKN